MSRSDDEHSGRLARREIFEVRHRVKQVRSDLYEALNHRGSVPRSLQHELRKVLLQYWDVLHEYDEDVEDEWEDNDLDAIPVLARQTTTVTRQKPGYGPHYETVEVPKLQAVDFWELWQYTLELDRIAKELGFAAPASESTKLTEIDEELMEEVEEWRQNNLE